MNIERLGIAVVVSLCFAVSTASAEVVGVFTPVLGNTTSSVNPWSATTTDAYDNLWGYDPGYDLFCTYNTEDAPLITTTATGLDPSHRYRVSIIIMQEGSHVRAVESGGELATYDASSPGAFSIGSYQSLPYSQVPVFETSGVSQTAMDIDNAILTYATIVRGIACEDLGAVPEPGMSVLLVTLGLSALWFRRNRSS